MLLIWPEAIPIVSCQKGLREGSFSHSLKLIGKDSFIPTDQCLKEFGCEAITGQQHEVQAAL